MTPIVQAAAIAALTLGTGVATVSVMNAGIPDMAVPDAAWAPGTALDGRAFHIDAVLQPGDRTDTDTLRFADGAFMSMGCEEYCNFGWSGYQTWTDGDVIHFTATTQCATNPHTVVWHGQVTGDTIAVKMSWTTRRWYWTHQIMGTAQGTALPTAAG
ncbi:MAG: hypothetical protein AAFY75_16665 [Pseudomonadota bacterium]